MNPPVLARLKSALPLGAALGLLFIFWVSSARLSQSPMPLVSQGLQVNLPLFVQVLLAGGDRYAAANIGTFRSLVASVEAQDDPGLLVQAEIQKDVAQLNAGHEDNYYLAAASLVGTVQHDAGQFVLRRAIDARPFDYVPPFLYGVHRMFYDRDPLDGAHWMQVAALRAPSEANRSAMEKTAVRWIQKGQEPAMAAAVLEAMAKQARTPALRHYIEQRAVQARQLADLRQAAEHFKAAHSRPPARLGDLVQSKIIDALPKDPLGMGFELNAEGVPIITPRRGSGTEKGRK